MPCDAFVIALLNEDGLTYDGGVYIIDQRCPSSFLKSAFTCRRRDDGAVDEIGAPVRVDDWDADGDVQHGSNHPRREGGGTRSVSGCAIIPP